MSNLLDGNAVARKIDEHTEIIISRSGVKPNIAIAVGTKDPSTKQYVESIKKKATNLGISINITEMNEKNDENTLRQLATDKSINGIIIQTPFDYEVDIGKLRNLMIPRRSFA